MNQDNKKILEEIIKMSNCCCHIGNVFCPKCEGKKLLNALDTLDEGWLRKYLSNYRGGLITMREALDKIQALSQKFDRPLDEGKTSKIIQETKNIEKINPYCIGYYIMKNWADKIAHALREAHKKGELYG